MVKVQKSKKGQFFVTIPQYLIDIMELEKGDNLEFFVNMKTGIIEIRKR